MKLNQEIIDKTKILWDYHRIDNKLKKVDLIFCLTSIDLRSAHRAAEIYHQGYANKILFSGGICHTSQNDLLKTNWKESEAVIFSKEAIKLGVPESNILIESKAQNTGDNIKLGYELLKDKNIIPKSMILVQKPYMGRRTYSTFMKQWPGEKIEILITSPLISFEEYFNVSEIDQIILINLIVGDLQRIKIYPQKGFQIYQDIPKQVWEAYNYLINAGFNKHLIKEIQ